MEGGSTYIPRGLKMAADRLSTFSRNSFKIQPSGSDVSGPNQNSTFVLPSASLIDLHSFRVVADVETTGVTDGTHTIHAKLPGDGSSLIHRMTVSANGTQLSQGCNEYNSVARILKIASTSRDRDLSTDRLLSFSTMNDEESNDHVTMVWHQFLGLFSQASVRYLDTSILGSLQVQFSWAGNELMVARGSAGLGEDFTAGEKGLTGELRYTIRNLYAVIDTICVDQLYGDLLRKRLNEQGYVSLLMKEYYTFAMSGIAATSANMRFALSSGSIDKIYGVLRNDKYAQRHQLAHYIDGAVLGDATVAPYFVYPTYDSLSKRDGSLRYQWNVNGIQYPQHQATVSNAAFDLAYSNNLAETNTGNLVNSRDMFVDSHGVFTLLLNLPDEGIQLQSGMDARGVSSQMQLAFTGINQPGNGETLNCFVVACCTQEIRIGQGLSIAVAH